MDSKVVEISVDNTEEEVLKFNEDDNVNVTFASEIGKFKELPEKVVSKLYSQATKAYWVSWTLHRAAVQQEKDGGPAKTKVIAQPVAARATNRIHVGNKNPKMHYEWMLPQQIAEMGYKGWRHCEDPNVDTFAHPAAGVHKMASPSEPGVDEQLLMEIPQELFAKYEEQRKEKNKGQRESSPEAKFKDEALKSGVAAFEPKENDGRSWSDVQSERPVEVVE